MREAPRALRRRARGASMLEFVVVGIVIAVLTGVLLQRLYIYRVQAEQAAVQRLVAVLQAALAARAANPVAQGRTDELARLALQNPMGWLARPPANYVGEYFMPAPEAVSPGHWYFDRKRHLLVYLLNFPEKFPHGIPEARYYQVKLMGRNNDFARPTGTPAHGGIALIEVEG